MKPFVASKENAVSCVCSRLFVSVVGILWMNPGRSASLQPRRYFGTCGRLITSIKSMSLEEKTKNRA